MSYQNKSKLYYTAFGKVKYIRSKDNRMFEPLHTLQVWFHASNFICVHRLTLAQVLRKICNRDPLSKRNQGGSIIAFCFFSGFHFGITQVLNFLGSLGPIRLAKSKWHEPAVLTAGGGKRCLRPGQRC